MGERPELLERLRQLLGLAGDAGSWPAPRPPYENGSPPGCEDVAEIPCDQAAKRVYEFLDGELDDADAEAIRCHIEQCRRCYPMYNWERLFLDVVSETADRPEPSDELRRRVSELLDAEVE